MMTMKMMSPALLSILLAAGCALTPTDEPASQGPSATGVAAIGAADDVAVATDEADLVQIEALTRSCYPAAGLCGVCAPGSAYDCLPAVPNPRKGKAEDWSCYCCSGTSCE